MRTKWLLALGVVIAIAGTTASCRKRVSRYPGSVHLLCFGLEEFLRSRLLFLEDQENYSPFPVEAIDLLLQQASFCAHARDVDESGDKRITRLFEEFRRTALRFVTSMRRDGSMTVHGEKSIEDLKSMIEILREINAYPIRE